ncbi:MAG: hypothetical protein QM698_05555 [Micropepsaceae bacterium]
MTPRELTEAMQGAPFTAAALAPDGVLALIFGPWMFTITGGWRILDEAAQMAGQGDADAAARLAALRMGELQGIQPLSKFDIAIRAAERWMIEIYALGATAANTLVIAGPDDLRAVWTATGDLDIARAS